MEVEFVGFLFKLWHYSVVSCEHRLHDTSPFKGPGGVYYVQVLLMVGCQSDGNMNPSLHAFTQGSVGS